MKHLSILIPTYNDPCLALVNTLQQQAEEAGICYEIIVADDASTDDAVKQHNRQINLLPHCRVEERKENVGRAVIRNVDSDMVVCRQDYLKCYAHTDDNELVVDGGICVDNVQKDNLRALYEKSAEPRHTAALRQQSPYQHLHTANILIRRDIMLSHPFDARFRH